MDFLNQVDTPHKESECPVINPRKGHNTHPTGKKLQTLNTSRSLRNSPHIREQCKNSKFPLRSSICRRLKSETFAENDTVSCRSHAKTSLFEVPIQKNNKPHSRCRSKDLTQGSFGVSTEIMNLCRVDMK